ncbi:MAG: hypothetical protein ABIH11_00190 [Candidatus Altiarchaeota archaeon]
MKDNFKIMLGVSVLGLVLLGLVLFLIGGRGGMKSFMLVESGLVLILLMGFTYVVVEKSREHKKGLPIEDELSKKLAYQMGTYAYYSAIWISVGLIWYNGFICDNLGTTPLDAGESLGVVILLSGIIYLGMYFILRGRVGST